MNFLRNAVYSYVRNIVLDEHPGTYISSRFEPTPESFPAVFIREISSYSVD